MSDVAVRTAPPIGGPSCLNLCMAIYNMISKCYWLFVSWLLLQNVSIRLSSKVVRNIPEQRICQFGTQVSRDTTRQEKEKQNQSSGQASRIILNIDEMLK